MFIIHDMNNNLILLLKSSIPSGTTMVAAMKAGRNSIGIEIDPEYCRMAAARLRGENHDKKSAEVRERALRKNMHPER